MTLNIEETLNKIEILIKMIQNPIISDDYKDLAEIRIEILQNHLKTLLNKGKVTI